MKNNKIDLGVVRKVAVALGELNEEVIFVGGAVVSLYINDPAADEIRPTKDIDLSLNLVGLTELELLREKLIQKGFVQRHEDDVVCRFRFEEIKVDVMNTKSIGWASTNPWFSGGFKQRQTVEIEGQTIQIMPLPYFLASKFIAHKDRGGDDPRQSHDFEDIAYILDNRIDFEEEVAKSKADVAAFLVDEFNSILSDQKKKEAIPGNIYFDFQTIRFPKILQKLENCIQVLSQ